MPSHIASSICLQAIMVLFCLANGVSPATTPPKPPTTQYEVINLGEDYEPYALNDKGVVVGQRSSVVAGVVRGFVWRDDSITYVEPLGSDTYCEVTAVNNKGVALCRCSGKLKPFGTYFVWNAGKSIRIEPPPDYEIADATAINNRGDVVGTVRKEKIGYPGFVVNKSPGRAFVFRQGKTSLLPTLNESGDSGAYGINDKGQIVGYDTAKDGMSVYAALWEKGTVRAIKAPKSLRAEAVRINNPGQIVLYVYSNTPGFLRAETGYFLNSKDSYQALKGPDEYFGHTVDTMNDRGEVLFHSYKRPSEFGGQPRSYWLWRKDGVTMLDDTLFVGNPDWAMLHVSGINNRGELIGNAFYKERSHGVLLKPKKERANRQ